MCGSDPDAALYYLARMLEAGEDVKYIARRMLVAASEEVGNADPMAICVAASAAIGVERVGMPEQKSLAAVSATSMRITIRITGWSSSIFPMRSVKNKSMSRMISDTRKT